MAKRDFSSNPCSEVGGSFSIQVSEFVESEKSSLTRVLKQPSLHLLSGKKRKLCCSERLLLYKAALKGEMKEIEGLFEKDYRSIICAAITEGHQTVLHVATGAKQTSFVQQLLTFMDPEDLMLQDENGNTAFCFAAAVGAVDIANLMLKKNPSLLGIRGSKNMPPLYFAALFGQTDTASFLFHKSEKELPTEDRKVIFITSVDTGLYDLALKLLKNDRQLALTHHVKHGTALHMLARNPFPFAGRGIMKCSRNIELMNNQALELVKCLWKEINRQQDVDVAEVIRKPTNLLLDAAEVGNFRFLAELIGSYPDFVHELDENGRSIFHIAILNRHMNVFNLIYEQGFNKQLLATYLDSCGNNILHLAAKYRSPSPYRTVSGAALEMQRELLIYKEVEMIVQPSYREMKNYDGKTPRELFTVEHLELLRREEQWMKNRASASIIVATLVATMAFAAAFIVPGGKDDKTGLPIHLRENWFQVFAISDAIAFSCSVISVAFFLSILTSQFAEDDFLRSLPLKLLGGLSVLFVSIVFVLVAFFSTLFLAYDHGVNWIVVPSGLVSFVPTVVIALLQVPVLKDIFCSTCCPSLAM
ncbi:ANK REP REGION domain-containing protein [Citrus sinensis]|uniref:ANK REP REGION domain-containing protein n=1 Tax=Citrus sinensis TaxID=2711 RepID=A0ACB8KG06_CITSI|nr:ANK REP REGION domain-containing protein [Citrus sinensis]